MGNVKPECRTDSFSEAKMHFTERRGRVINTYVSCFGISRIQISAQRPHNLTRDFVVTLNPK
jgi:hypothetical protein